MALTATMYRLQVELSDVDRSVYEQLDLRLARHPSESVRYLVTRLIAYCLSYEPGIAFSKGGLSDAEEPPITVRDATGVLRAWIDVGSPSAERLHKAAKSADRVALFTHANPALLRREAASRPVYRLEAIEVWHIEARLLDSLEPHLDRNLKLELVRTEGQLYFTLPGAAVAGTLQRLSLVEQQGAP